VTHERAGLDSVEVHLHAPELGAAARLGTLRQRRARGAGTLSFSYDDAWLRGPRAFTLDPRLELFAGEQYPAAGHETFGIFLDSAPDRWGRLLLDRREALAARQERRRARALGDWDYLLGVQDECRMGALRFRAGAAAPFLAESALAVPPVASLPELEAACLALEQDHAEDAPAYAQWLSLLVAPGTSLGGARPKANYREADGTLWIAKFPSREDRRDVGGWEHVLYGLAADCGIDVAPCARRRFNSRYHTFCVRRFDRAAGGRRFFVSALTLLDRRDGEGGSYLEIAEFIQNQGAQDGIARDLQQLFRRVLFNVLVGNTDDHLRNHGFIRQPSGWRLAPAYDLNPNPARRSHALRLDETSDLPELDTVMATAPYYRVKPTAARRLLERMRKLTRTWRDRARAARLAATEAAAVEAAFEVSG
jgi:serine/threonine-protein kinase HipA